MARRRLEAKNSDRRDQYTVVLEDLRSQFRVFGEALMAVDDTVKTGFQRVDEKFQEIDEKFIVVNEKLDEHTKKLDEHTKKLDEHTKKLDEHTKKLDEHTKKLDSHTEMIVQLMVDVAEIKNDLKQKVGRDEFARLEKRVLLLERRLR